MEGQEFYEQFVRFVHEHEMRGAIFGPGATPPWNELRDRSKALWSDLASTLELRSQTINERMKTAR